MGFGPLRVINEDRVQPGRGFGPHPHRDMEIISYVLDGALGHIDSTGERGVIRAGEVQRMSAGTGIVHGEENASAEEPVHFLQIWIEPDRLGHTPSYVQQPVDAAPGALTLIASPDGRDGALDIHQDVSLHVARIANGESLTHGLTPDRSAWVQVTRGTLSLNGNTLHAGDGAAVTDEAQLELSGDAGAEALVFDLPAVS